MRPTTFTGILRTATVAPVNPPKQPQASHKRVDLFNSMCSGTPITVMSRPDGRLYTGIVNSITREDGSGHKFLIRLHNSPNILYVVMM